MSEGSLGNGDSWRHAEIWSIFALCCSIFLLGMCVCVCVLCVCVCVCVLCARLHACDIEAVANPARVQATIATRYGVFELFCSGQHGVHGYSQQ